MMANPLQRLKIKTCFVFDYVSLTQDSQFESLGAEKSQVFHLSGLTITKALNDTTVNNYRQFIGIL